VRPLIRIEGLHVARFKLTIQMRSFRIRLHEKDMKIALATGSEYGVPLMVSGVVAQMMTAMKGMALADLDHSALVKLIESLAKKELG